MEENKLLVRRMVRALNKMDGVYYYFARSFGANENTLTFFYALDDGELHSQKQISEEWGIPKTTINTIVKTMVAEGYITLETGTHGRNKCIRLTDSGKAYAKKLLREIYEAEQAAIKDTLESYSPDFVDALERFGDRFQERYCEITHKA